MRPTITIQGLDEAFEDIDVMLRAVDEKFQLDLAELEQPVLAIIAKGRERMGLAGTDVAGRPLTRICAETWERRMRAGKGAGPALSPDWLSSSPRSKMVVLADADGPNRLLVLMDWPGAPWLAKHAEGITFRLRGRIVRDVLGLDPQTLAELHELLSGYVDEKVGGRSWTARLKRSASRILGRLFK